MKYGIPILDMYNHSPSLIKYLTIRACLARKGVKVGWSRDINLFKKIDGRMQIAIKGSKGCRIKNNCEINAQVTLEEEVLIDDGCRLIGGPIFIGRGTNFMKNSEIIGPVKIGRYCAIARNNVFQSANHSVYMASMQRGFYHKKFHKTIPTVTKGGIDVGSDVWLGTRCIILPGVKIGNGAVIGAGSVVTKDVEPYSIVAGVPAKHIKYRFKKTKRKTLLKLKWWNWNDEKIRQNKDFFIVDIQKVDDFFSLIK